jgi:hypothetical protein
MSEYLILIHDDEQAWIEADREIYDRTLRQHQEFLVANAEHLRGGHRLRSSSTATSIRRDHAGTVVVTDGAFVESKEVLGGYYLIEAADLDEAIAIAAQVPAPYGGVEVRPVWPTDEP